MRKHIARSILALIFVCVKKKRKVHQNKRKKDDLEQIEEIKTKLNLTFKRDLVCFGIQKVKNRQFKLAKLAQIKLKSFFLGRH